MAGDGIPVDLVSLSGWHTIRPWTPPLSLSVREITSVSATFILSASLHDLSVDGDPSLASLGIIEEDSNDDEDDDDGSDSQERKRPSAVAAALAGGLKVEVDSSTWRKVFIRIDDKADEAVIIIYGLMPCRQYDIDLELVQGGQKNNIRRQVVTEEIEQHIPEDDVEEDSTIFDHSNSPDPQLSTPSTSPGRTMPNTPPGNPSPGFAPLTLEDRLNQLQHALSLITAERDNLTVSLKSAKKDSQKADAALRSEIEVLKRASEKYNGSEHRAKQKALALQEAVKRAQTSTREMEERIAEMEEVLPTLKAQREEKENFYSEMKTDADRVRQEKDAETEKERKRLDAMKGELTGLTNKLDRLTGKKEKLETSAIPDLEQQLKDIELEIGKVEMDPYGYSPDHQLEMVDVMDVSGPERDRSDSNPDQHNYLPPLRGRSSLPASTNVTSPRSSQAARTTQPFYTRQAQHNQRASSVQFTQTPTLLTNPHRQSSLKSPRANTAVASSTLSSRAAPFEPGKPLRPSAPSYSGTSLPNVRGQRSSKWSQ